MEVAPAGNDFCREFVFDPTRRWRFDFASPQMKVAAEIQGRGRHQRILGERQDFEKYRAGAMAGWYILLFQAADRGNIANWATDFLTCIVNRYQRENK